MLHGKLFDPSSEFFIASNTSKVYSDSFHALFYWSYAIFIIIIVIIIIIIISIIII